MRRGATFRMTCAVLVASAACSTDDVPTSIDASDTRGPTSASAFATLADFVAVLRADHEAPPIALADADFDRLFATVDRGRLDPGASHRFDDLDGDGDVEGIVAVGDGWWGHRVDLCRFVRHADHWRLAASLRLDGNARGVPRLTPLAGVGRAFVTATWGDTWGTGIWTRRIRVFELVEGQFVETLQALDSGEFAAWGLAHGLEVATDRLVLEPDTAGDGLVARLDYDVTTSDSFGDAFTVSAITVRTEYVQRRRGDPFVRRVPTGDVDIDALLVRGLRSWFDQNAEPARLLARDGDLQSRRWLRRASALVLDNGPHAVAAACAASIPADIDERAR